MPKQKTGVSNIIRIIRGGNHKQIKKEATTENKWATEKRKGNKEKNLFVNFNMGRGKHGKGCCEPNKAKIIQEKVDSACRRGLEVCSRII